MQLGRVIKGPDVGTDADAEVEHLLADDIVVRHLHAGVAAGVFAVDHVDGAKAEVLVGAGDGVARDGAAGGAKDNDAAVGRPSDLDGQSTYVPDIMVLYKPDCSALAS